MLKLIKYELYKAIKNINMIIIFIIINILFAGYGIYYANTNHDFVDTQHKEAETMILKINEYTEKDYPEVQKQSSYYFQLLQSQTWQECYAILNQIDQLYIDYPTLIEKNESDLSYDEKTNIEYRNYCLKHSVNPDEQSGYRYMQFIMTHGLDIFLLLSLIFIIFIYYDEDNENECSYYIYGLSYSYKQIVISQWISGIIIGLVIVLLPFLYTFGIETLLCGLGNHNILIQSSLLHHDTLVNTIPFMTITHYILEIIKTIIFEIILLSAIINCVKRIVSNKYFLFMILLIGFGCFYMLGFPIFVGKSGLSTFSLPVEILVVFGGMMICLSVAIMALKKIDIKNK